MTNMSVPGPYSGTDNTVRDWGVSWLRTAVPVLWGFLLTFLATRVPFLYALLDDARVYALVESALTLAWYGAWRWIEQHLPPWLTRLVLGSNRAPAYGPSVPEIR